MKAKLLRDSKGPDPRRAGEVVQCGPKVGGELVRSGLGRLVDAAKGQVLLLSDCILQRDIPAGTVIDDPEAWLLVQTGMAVPEDEECAFAAGMTETQLAAAAEVQARMQAGLGYDVAALEEGDDAERRRRRRMK